MPRFMIQMTYSSASWARMIAHADDRPKAVGELMEHLNGKLEAMYWDMGRASTYIIGELPDSMSAAAIITVATGTGGYKDVEAREILDQEQVRAIVALARSSEGVFSPPGKAALERDDI
jgi:uncharacterized protein with GYD domain